MASVLVVDDDPLMVENVGRMLEKAGHTVRRAGSAEEAAGLIDADPPDLVVMDVMLPGKGGLSFVMERAMSGVTTGFVMMSGAVDTGLEAFQGLAGRFGVACLLRKPFEAGELIAAVEAALAKACA